MRIAAGTAPLAIVALTGAALLVAAKSEGYTPFVLALVALTTVVGVGLNILVGLTGQISLGHVGFYAIGAYTVAILTLKGVDFWIAFPLAGAVAGAVGFMLALPALRVSGPYLAMVTIAFAFIVQHGTIEWRELTGGANGLLGIPPPSLGALTFSERELAMLATVLAGASLYAFHRLARSGWGMAMIAVRDGEAAARAIGLNPVIVKTAAFSLSALFTGLAGGIFAPLLMFVAPDSFPFSQSILFLFVVVVGGAGWTFGPVAGALVSVVLPELLSGLAEYRLLFFGAALLVILWVAPEGILGTLARLRRRADRAAPAAAPFDVAAFLAPEGPRAALDVRDIGITFGGITAATAVTFSALPGKVTSVIGPNGAGKTTVLNLIGGFYRPDSGSIRLGARELAGAPAWRVARAGIARTHQTTRLFATMSVVDNVLVALRRGRLGSMVAAAASRADRRTAEALLAFVGYHGSPAVPAGDLPHVDRRLVEIARALAMRPRVLLLDEPAAGLMRSDKDALSRLIRRIADLGIAIVLVEHDMLLVMGISDAVVVLDAGLRIAAGSPAEVRRDPKVLKAYLGGGEMRARPRPVPWNGARDAVLTALKLTAGYGAAPVLDNVSLDVRPGEMVTLIGANGAGKSTMMRAISGLLRPVEGAIVLDDARIDALETHRIARRGLALVPEGRQVFPELTVIDNLVLGAHARKDADRGAEIEGLLARFPRLRERLGLRAGLLSGGEQQMLAIARGLMAKPRILLLDEPSLGLAPAMINELFDILAGLRDDGVTILLVDQMAQLALTVADRGYVLELGRIVRADDAAGLAEDPELEAAYLGRSEAAQKRRRAVPLDLVLRQGRLAGGERGEERLVDIGVADGRIVEIAQAIATDAPQERLDGRLVIAGFVETHIHLDKAHILDRCGCVQGTLAEAIAAVAAAKRTFTADDIYARAQRTLEKAIVQGTTRMRTHVEVDPRVGLTGFHALRRLAHDYAWAIDLELCVFPQEGLTNDPGAEELLVVACEEGADVIGGCPYTDTDPEAQIARIFAIARRFDLDVDFHLDFDLDPSWMHLDAVCRRTEAQRWGGRVAVGHATKLSAVDPSRLDAIARRLADAGVAVTVLPATDLFLMGRDRDHDVPRGVAPAHRLLQHGVTCALATNNVLNPFTPFGDCSLIRMANLYANTAQLGGTDDLRACFDMVTTLPARLMNVSDYGIAAGHPADLVVLDSRDPAMAVAELAPPLFGWKRGRRSFTRAAALLHKP